MAFEGVPLTSISETDLQSLIGTSESRDIDFKRQYEQGSGAELGADVAAMANTIGGHILVGIDEDKAGIATTLVGVDGNADKERSRLQSMILDNIEPRVTGVEIHPIPLKNGNTAFVIQVPRSWNAPHRVPQSRRYWIRAGTQKTEPDVDELRTLFTSGLTTQQRLRDYRHGRVAKIRAGDVPVQIEQGGGIVLHIIPSDAFQGGKNVSIKELRAIPGTFYSRFAPLSSNSGVNFRPRLEGYAAYSTPEPTASYIMVHKNGIIEATKSDIHWERDGHKISHFNQFFDVLEKGFGYCESLKFLGFKPPLTIFLTAYDMKGTLLKVGRNNYDQRPFQDNYLPFGEVVLDDFLENNAAFQKSCSPILTEVANAAGYEDAPDGKV